MTTFDEREQAFEQMFVHDEEARFRALARRNHLLGRWAAEQMGLSGEAARAYANEIMRSVVTAAVDEGLIQRIRADAQAHSVDLAEERIRERMGELMAMAVEEVKQSPW